jgi:hypothetical protein
MSGRIVRDGVLTILGAHMTADEFCRYGEAIFGPCWHGRMAEALGYNPRTITRWANGQRAIPGDLEAEIRTQLVPAQIAALRAL